jgi:hypothetical protein
MAVVDILTQHGIRNPQLVIETAQTAGLELAAACAMLEKESAGGRNLWGQDGVPTGDAYVKGSEVTRDAYMAYVRAIELGRAGRQGVGPCQLTYGPLQKQADDLGGCWDVRFNIRVGFGHLAGLIRSYGLHDGFRRYNGSGAAAVRYADDAMAKLGTWRARLAGSSATSPGGGATSPAVLKQGDTGPAVEKLQRWLNAHYPAYSKLPILTPPRYGPQTVAVIREFQRRSGVTGSDADGQTVGPRTWTALLKAGYRP